MEQTINSTTIAAVATPPGRGGLAVIRLSGPDAFAIAAHVWRGKLLEDCRSHTAHLGDIVDENGEVLDNAVATVFRGPKSFTGEDTIEFSLHASLWIQREVMNALMKAGATPAGPGEFSRRAFTNGRLDLAQTEGIADLIAASSRAAQRMAMQQTKGDFSRQINSLRDKMIKFASLLELELDFSEEDVEFADRENLLNLCNEISGYVGRLADSYKAGKVFKEGIPTVIVGQPNVGKSTLLNHLLNDERAIVSSIPGTTRDVIEDTVEFGGILFRISDTAGLHEADDEIEKAGIGLAHKKISNARIILWLVDSAESIESQKNIYHNIKHLSNEDSRILTILSKIDLISNEELSQKIKEIEHLTGNTPITISVNKQIGLQILEETLCQTATSDYDPSSELIITNARHYDSLSKARESILRAQTGIKSGTSADFIAQDVREAIHHLTTITGAITTDSLLSSIFANFCIGK